MESLRHYLAVTIVILLSLAGVASAQVPSMAARSLSLASPPDAKVPFASLTNSNIVPQVNGTITYCSDCNQTPVCAAGGTGAVALLVNNAWQCGLGISQTGTVSINPGMAGQVGGYVASGSTISPLSSISGVNVNGVLNAQTFGAKGDGIYSGHGVHLADGTTNGTTTFTSASGNFTAALTGDQVFIEKAGTSGNTYAGTVASVTNATTLVLSSIPPNAIAGTGVYVIGVDNTTALTAFTTAMRGSAGTPTKPGYLPQGVYVHHGADFAAIPGLALSGASAGLMGAGSGITQSGTLLLCINPTPAMGNGGKLCHDFSGSILGTIHDLTFANGIDDATSGGPNSVNALFARVTGSSNYFGIENQIQNVIFRGWGGPTAYDVVNYGYEQTDWLDDIFNWDQDTAKPVYLSVLNTPGFTSPRLGSLAAPPTSTTAQTFTGGKTQVSTNGCPNGVFTCATTDAGVVAQAGVTIDGNVQGVNFIGGFYRLNGPKDALFMDSSPHVYTNWQLSGIYIENGQTGSVANAVTNFQGDMNQWTVTGGWFGLTGSPTRTAPDFKADGIFTSAFQNYGASALYSPAGKPQEVLCTGTGANSTNSYFGGIPAPYIQGCNADSLAENNYNGMVGAMAFFGRGAATVSGGGALGTGSNSVAGEINNVAATNNLLTPGFDCSNLPGGGARIVVSLFDESFPPGQISLAGQSATQINFSATAGHNIGYILSCG